jgi:hypothetical protein
VIDKVYMTEEDMNKALKWSRDTIVRQAEDIERLREACGAVLDNRIDLGIAINKCRAAYEMTKENK